MTQFMVLYRSPVSAREQLASATPEQQQAGMDAWLGWANENRDAIVELGRPVAGSACVAPGSVSDSGSDVCGYSIVRAESVDDVTRMLAAHPHLHTAGGASIEVLEFVPIPGM